MSLYLLVRDHRLHTGAIEVGWRVDLAFGHALEGDLIFSYHASLEAMLAWARRPDRQWRKKMPFGVIDERDLLAPEEKLFESVPALASIPYYAGVGSGGEVRVSMDDLSGRTASIGRREVLISAFGAEFGTGSVRDRLQAKFMHDLNRIDEWAKDTRYNG